MKREEFLNQPEVDEFINWLVENLPRLTFRLDFKTSKFVSGGLKAEVEGFGQVIQHYRWKAQWFDARQVPVHSEHWASTYRSLGQLRHWLACAVAADDELQTLQACLQVLRWGGVRGAVVFLHRLAAERRLVQYLKTTKALMSLDGDAQLTDLNLASVERFDAGLTKIHALLDTSGSPIYDSRVGAAAAMLYSLFRQQSPHKAKSTLAFASGAARGSQIRNPQAFIGGLAAPQFSTLEYAAWAQCQVRLGWVVRAVLLRMPTLFTDQETLVARCHAFEASLFVLGYDLRCFGVPMKIHQRQAEVSEVETASSTQQLQQDNDARGWVPTGHPFTSILNDYEVFRRSGLADNKESFAKWLVARRSTAEATSTAALSVSSARSYCFPFSIQEFDLFGRDIESLEHIVAGGERGLCAVMGVPDLEPFTLGDERESVCLVDVLLTGRLYKRGLSSEQRVASLVDSGFAGTSKSAATLMAVGRGVGKHFGLLGADHQPTELYDRFFGSVGEL